MVFERKTCGRLRENQPRKKNMNLTHLTDKTLLQNIKVLVKKEKDLSVSILHHLCEIDDRRLYAELKYSSLFDYYVNHLGYFEDAAQRRISASRLMKRNR